MKETTPLWVACRHGHVEIVKLLLAAGVNANEGNNVGVTPIDIAREKGHTEIVKILKEHIRLDVAKKFYARHKQKKRKYITPDIQKHIAGFLTGNYYQYVVGETFLDE